MTSKKSFQRPLILSVLSLLLCLALFAGTTFAWFTDSITNTKNKILAGNLDIALQYYAENTWKDLTAESLLFDEDALWEPGHTEVVYLKVSNLGTLALKYQLSVNIIKEIASINVNNEEFKLSDYIKYNVIEGKEPSYATREDAVKAANELSDAKAISSPYRKSAAMAAGEKDLYLALVVYMPQDVGNVANYKTGMQPPEIHLGLNLSATQVENEKEFDSFDWKYDEGTKLPHIPFARVTKLADMPEVTAVNGKKYTLDTAYLFSTTDTYEEAQVNAHAKWHADFVVTLDKEIYAKDLGLAGQYDAYDDDWLAFLASDYLSNEKIAANEPIRLLGTAGISMNYEELCLVVENFYCGAFEANDGALNGVTMTVELRMYETEDPAVAGSANVETGKYEVIGSYEYKFGDGTSLVTKSAETVKADEVIMLDTPLTEDITLDTYTFTASKFEDMYPAADYGDWNCDYFVSTDKPVNEGLVLLGNYGNYGWVGFQAPESTEPYEPTPLLTSVATIPWTYNRVIDEVSEFTCGLKDVGGNNTGTTVTVELRLWNDTTNETITVVEIAVLL